MLLKPTPSVALRPAQRSFSTPARVLVAACNAPGREQAAGPQSGRPGSTPVPALPHATHGMQQQQQQPSAAIAALAAPLMVQQIQRGLKKLALLARRARLRELLFGGQQLGGQPLALAALALPAGMPMLPGGGMCDLFSNCVFLAGFSAWGVAQIMKIFTKRLKKGVWDIRAVVDSGGMPSSHSALCAGITTAIAMQHGLGSSTFALAIALSSIVMYDAAGVRRHAGKQAEVLNQVISELLHMHPVSQVQLKEVLGHTPLQVCAGAVLGILAGYFFPYGRFCTAALAP